MYRVLFLSCLWLFAFTIKPAKPAYQIFSGDKGKSIHYQKMMKALSDADIVFFGESHNNSICHWLQLQVLKDLEAATGKEVIVGAEMFEADDQLILNEYLEGHIKEDHLLKEAKVWDNYKTDYAPIVNFAKAHNMPFIATNIPRRYASIVASKGLEGLNDLDEEAKKYIAPLPVEIDFELSSYKEILEMMGAHARGSSKNIVAAQAIKDATMAHFTLLNLDKKKVFYHLNGSFHSKNREGIVYFLQQNDPSLNIKTITVVDQPDLDSLKEEHLNLADFVIAIPEDMTKTY